MDRQASLFADEEDGGSIAKKIIKRPGTMGKKPEVISPPIILNKEGKVPFYDPNEEIPYKKEVERLLQATYNRSLLKEWYGHELRHISDHLVRVSKKIGRNIEVITDLAVLTLKNRTNLYATQAIDFVVGGDSFKMLKERTKPKIIRRNL